MTTTSKSGSFSWDIDHHLNPYIPRPRLHLLPKPISHFLGHRAKPIKPIPQYMVWFWSFIGAFIGLTLASLFFQIPHLVNLTSQSLRPGNADIGSAHLIILGSLGASAILEYNAVTSPLAQPRNAILGQGLSATIGIALLRLFQLMHDPERVEDLRWIAGALAVGISSAAMGMTKTVYPPAGATALLAATSQQVGDLGWLLIPVAMGASTIMVITALFINNIQRQFPMWWWTELPLAKPEKTDEEKAAAAANDGLDLKKVQTSDSERTLEKADSRHVEHAYGRNEEDVFRITPFGIHVPERIQLSTEEYAFLEILKGKFEMGESESRSSNDTFVGSS